MRSQKLLQRAMATLVASAILHTAEVPAQATPAPPETTGSAVSTTPLQIQDLLLSPSLSSARRSSAKVDTIVLHFVSDIMDNPDDPYRPERIRDIFSKFKVSANYLIGRDGTIYRLVPDDRAAFHAGGGKLPRDSGRKGSMNQRSIGIEILAIGSAKDMAIYEDLDYAKFAKEHPELIGFTEEQYRALNKLIDHLIQKYPAIKRDRGHIVGHSEVDPSRKTDPGELFDWSKLGLPKEP